MGACALATAGGLLVVPASVAAGSPPAPFQQAAAGCDVSLPGGVRVTVTAGPGGGAARITPGTHAGPVLTYRSGGHAFVVPVTALGRKTSAGLGAFDATALAARTCGTPVPAASGAGRHGGAGHDAYSMARLTVRGLTTQGDPAAFQQVLLMNTDDSAYADQLNGLGSAGRMQVSVPRGDYAAALIDYEADGKTRIVIEPDVRVSDGTTITLNAADARTAPTVPATPRPANLVDSALAVYRSDGTPAGDSTGLWLEMLDNAPTPLPVLLGTTGPARHGRLSVLSSFELDSPADAAQPYAYHLSSAFDRLPAAYPAKVTAGSLATVLRTYDTAGAGGSNLVVDSVAPRWAAQEAAWAVPGYDFVPVPGSRTEYYTGDRELTWRTQVEDTARQVDFTGADRVYTPGAHLTDSWGAGALHPAPQTGTGAALSYCGACATTGTMNFAIGDDGDSTPGTLGQGFGPATRDVTLERDGTLVAAGDGGLFEASVPVDAGRARWALRLRTTRTDPATTQSPAADTTWTFTTDPGHGAPLPGSLYCYGATTDCTALPLLYAWARTDAGPDNTLTPGRHVLSLTVRGQQGSSAGPATGATADVSYDGGTTWHALRTTGHAGAFTAPFTVPAGASGGTVSLRLSARDAHGDRIDQTLPAAYLVR